MKPKSRWSTLLKYGITTAVAGAMTASVLSLHGFAEAVEAVDRYRILSDAFTIPGVVIMLLGVLVWVANEGAFDGLTYVVRYAIRMLLPGGSRDHEKYGDYVASRREKGGVRGYGFLFIVGGVFFAAGLVCIALFYSVYTG